MKNILLKGSLLGLIFIMSQSFAYVQNGKTIPDRLDILNDTNETVIIEDTQYKPGETAQVTTAGKMNIVPIYNQAKKIIRLISFEPGGSGPISKEFNVFNYRVSHTTSPTFSGPGQYTAHFKTPGATATLKELSVKPVAEKIINQEITIDQARKRLPEELLPALEEYLQFHQPAALLPTAPSHQPLPQ